MFAICPGTLNFVAFSIRESLAPKCLFVCWLWGKEDMVNKYSWGLCVEDMINEYNQKVLEYLKNWKNLEVKYQTQFSEIRYEKL